MEKWIRFNIIIQLRAQYDANGKLNPAQNIITPPNMFPVSFGMKTRIKLPQEIKYIQIHTFLTITIFEVIGM